MLIALVQPALLFQLPGFYLAIVLPFLSDTWLAAIQSDLCPYANGEDDPISEELAIQEADPSSVFLVGRLVKGKSGSIVDTGGRDRMTVKCEQVQMLGRGKRNHALIHQSTKLIDRRILASDSWTEAH